MSDGICRDYFESAECCAITKKRALHEIEKHNLASPEDITDFYRELGELNIYRAQNVLSWLGY
ncbi:hypothetical protein WB91_08700 [bacteria symbiont BFo1 of Frankliniella occidentalis]|uniref:hypothetical protein n=1 Tax=Erwinia aphidicola TaxID=68334 RepID=UPI000789D9BE|nr:hypothetical protein [Erwinia aphidicola]KYP90571.1 hypothetical protein WB91_08700 [bacteria symbiont BFo1 of Frankliniella occidentalis]CAH0298957.1 hypothetical protein SRABI13_04319 [Erwinia aphidicola]